MQCRAWVGLPCILAGDPCLRPTSHYTFSRCFMLQSQLDDDELPPALIEDVSDVSKLHKGSTIHDLGGLGEKSKVDLFMLFYLPLIRSTSPSHGFVGNFFTERPLKLDT